MDLQMPTPREPDGICPVHGAYRDPYSTNGEFRCRKCRDAAEESARPLMTQYDTDLRLWQGWRKQIPPRHANRTLANWNPANKGQETAKKIVTAFASDLPAQLEEGRGLLLLGPPGTGKTHLLCAIVSECWKAGIRAEYHVWPDVLSAVKDSFSAEKDHPGRGLLDRLSTVPFLALDELAIRTGTEYDQAALFDVIDYRYRNLLPTACATNATEKTLPTIGERTADRMRENMTFVSISGQSRRESVALDQSLRSSPPALNKPEQVRLQVQACINSEMQTKTWVYPKGAD